MGFLSPVAAMIAAGITVPLLVSLYFLKLCRRRVDVASTLLWRKAIRDMEVNAPFAKLRRSLLLLLQLLLLGALLFAMARPTLQAAARPGQRVVILIDHSASMNATDVSPSRLQRAKAAALELVANLDAGGAGGSGGASGGTSGGGGASGGAMVVSFAERARVVQPMTSDVARLRAAIRSIEPTDQSSRLGEALSLIEPFAAEAGLPGGGPSLVAYIFSDGRVEPVSAQRALVGGVEVRLVNPAAGADAPAAVDNLGLAALAARRDFERPHRVELFARLVNAGTDPVEANLTLRLDGRVAGVQAVRVPGATDRGPGEQGVEFGFTLTGGALVEVSHDHADALAVDDAARLVLAPSRRLRVLLVTRGNAFLERVIRSVGVRELVLMAPDRYEDQAAEQLVRAAWSTDSGSSAGFDLVVFDDVTPEEVPPINSVSFGAAPPIDGLAYRGPREGDPAAQAVLDWKRDHPLLQYVSLDDVVLSQPGRLIVPPQGTVLATGQAGPLMAEVPGRGARHVAAAFGVLRSNWPLYVSFPVFISNAMQSLGLGDASGGASLAYRTGQVPVLPAAAEAGELTYTGPDRLTARVQGGQMLLPALRRAGLYTAEQAGVAEPFDRLAVNLLDARESDLRPVQTLELGGASVAGQSREQAIRREVWPWFAWAALGLLMVEWLVYTRRMHL